MMIRISTSNPVSTLSFKFVYFLAQYSNISHLKSNKNPENISLYLRKFAFYLIFKSLLTIILAYLK